MEQTSHMRRLVNSLRLAPAAADAVGLGPEQQQQQQQQEQLVPDDTLNPSIQRFYWFIGQRALDPEQQVCVCACVGVCVCQLHTLDCGRPCMAKGVWQLKQQHLHKQQPGLRASFKTLLSGLASPLL
jgi:hypothetical protein